MEDENNTIAFVVINFDSPLYQPVDLCDFVKLFHMNSHKLRLLHFDRKCICYTCLL